MPLYDLACHQCGNRAEAFISLADYSRPLTPCSCGGERYRVISSPQVLRDIEPYQAMGVDVATGTAPMITSRSQHRDYLKRNNYVEIGNEVPKAERTETITERDVGRDIKKTIETKGIRL